VSEYVNSAIYLKVETIDFSITALSLVLVFCNAGYEPIS